MTIEPENCSSRLGGEDAHPQCFACGLKNERGLQLIFFRRPDGSVKAEILCRPEYQGYSGLMHGGLIATLLDEAMTQCLLARACYALTAKLDIRFLNPIQVGTPLTVCARETDSHPPLHILEAEVLQDGKVAARAVAKFVESKQADPREVRPGVETYDS